MSPRDRVIASLVKYNIAFDESDGDDALRSKLAEFYASRTLTRASILSARTILITLRGEASRQMLEQAIADGQSSKLPIGRVLAEADQPIDIHYMA